MVRACDPAKSGDNLSIQRNEYLGLEAQAETIRPWRWSTTGLIDIIVDGGESAKSLNRPGMARLLALVDAGDVKTVIIAKLDRLTRSVKDLCTLLERFERRGVALVSDLTKIYSVVMIKGRANGLPLLQVASADRRVKLNCSIKQSCDWCRDNLRYRGESGHNGSWRSRQTPTAADIHPSGGL